MDDPPSWGTLWKPPWSTSWSTSRPALALCPMDLWAMSPDVGGLESHRIPAPSSPCPKNRVTLHQQQRLTARFLKATVTLGKTKIHVEKPLVSLKQWSKYAGSFFRMLTLGQPSAVRLSAGRSDKTINMTWKNGKISGEAWTMAISRWSNGNMMEYDEICIYILYMYSLTWLYNG